MTGPRTETEPTVGDAMHDGVVTCRPDATLRIVAALLAAHRIHAVVVASAEEAAPCAVVTDRDVIVGHSRGDLDSRTAREAASEPTVTVRADLALRYASDAMAQYGTSHLVVTSPGDGKPIGIISSLDIANAIS